MYLVRFNFSPYCSNTGWLPPCSGTEPAGLTSSQPNFPQWAHHAGMADSTQDLSCLLPGLLGHRGSCAVPLDYEDIILLGTMVTLGGWGTRADGDTCLAGAFLVDTQSWQNLALVAIVTRKLRTHPCIVFPSTPGQSPWSSTPAPGNQFLK